MISGVLRMEEEEVSSLDLPRKAYKRVTFEVCLAVAKVSEPTSAVNENSREVLSLRYRSGVASGLHAAYKHRTSWTVFPSIYAVWNLESDNNIFLRVKNLPSRRRRKESNEGERKQKQFSLKNFDENDSIDETANGDNERHREFVRIPSCQLTCPGSDNYPDVAFARDLFKSKNRDAWTMHDEHESTTNDRRKGRSSSKKKKK